MRIRLGHIVGLGSGKLLRIPLAVATMSLLARTVGPAGIGEWAMLLAAGTLLSSLFLNWSQAGCVRFGREEWTSRHCLSQTWAARWPMILCGIGLSLLILIWQPTSFLERYYRLPKEQWPVVLVIVFYLWAQAETQSIYRATGNIRNLVGMPLVCDVLCIVYIWLALVCRLNENVHTLLVGFAGLFFIFWTGMWRRAFLKTTNPCSKVYLGARLQMIRYCWPLVPGFVFAYLSNWGDHILLQYFRTTEEVGNFDVSYQVMVALLGLASPLSILYLPKLIDQKRHTNDAEVIYLERTVPTLAAFWIGASMIGLSFLPWLFSKVLGPQYEAALPILLVLCAVIPGGAFLALYAILFELQRRLGHSITLSAAMVSANLCITYLLIGQLGGLGASIGTAASYILIQFLYLIDQHGITKIWKTKVFALFGLASAFGVAQYLAGSGLLTRISMAIAGIGCLVVLIKRCKIVDNDTVRELLPERFYVLCAKLTGGDSNR